MERRRLGELINERIKIDAELNDYFNELTANAEAAGNDEAKAIVDKIRNARSIGEFRECFWAYNKSMKKK